ncbi:MAG: hypothetical protein KA140_04800 [Caldisericia bacterium]|nr:hypothetical protein [Caldisericia bacterium]
MENLQGIKPAKMSSQKTLSGPITWIILIMFVLALFGFVQTLASDSPAVAMRSFFDKCFAGKYEDAWDMVKKGSDYSQQFNDKYSDFETMWTRTKTHGTTYLKVRIDGVEFGSKSTSTQQTAIVAYSIMTREQVKDDKTGTISNQINDANLGYITMEKLAGQGWKLIRPSR